MYSVWYEVNSFITFSTLFNNIIIIYVQFFLFLGLLPGGARGLAPATRFSVQIIIIIRETISADEI